MTLFFRRLVRRPLTLFGLVLVGLHLLVALVAPWITPYDPLKLLDAPLEPPTEAYWLGTDELGRDFFSRLLLGGQISIIAAACAGLIAAIGGGLLGLASAYHRGLFDDVVSRLVEMKLSIPSILLVSLFVTGFGQSLAVLVLTMGLIYMMGVIRTSRAMGLVILEQGYVKAAQLRGESSFAIILREMLPNILDLLTVEFALRTSSALLLVSALSFLGLGVSPPTPDWGLMIQSGLQSIRSEPWLVLAPSLCISSLVIGINFATEGVAGLLGLEAARGATGK
ncbi:ABC transporter permease [Rhabdaerophilum sp. SD176]|uniref:ABC transporter permease n=1 Tax=Rhabdaerophilum sp. SD176 TaxID=2983548 RepID=UPI0024E02B51|nr:ABC transporter permease [Rhabdaerophilum sp. SD176]